MLPAGKYYVGDMSIFLPLKKRHALLTQIQIETEESIELIEGEGVFEKKPFAYYFTSHTGEVTFPVTGVSNLNTLTTESGSFSCMLLDKTTRNYNPTKGILVEFKYPFGTSKKENTISFGHIKINMI